jgi:hypothetical protein
VGALIIASLELLPLELLPLELLPLKSLPLKLLPMAPKEAIASFTGDLLPLNIEF